MPQGPYGLAMANVSMTPPNAPIQLVTVAQRPVQLLEFRAGQESSTTSAMQSIEFATMSTGSSAGTSVTITLDAATAPATSLVAGTTTTTTSTNMTVGTVSSILVGPFSFNVLDSLN